METMTTSNATHDDPALPKHLWDKESKELRNAIYDDWKRKAIDSAKKRAVAQNVDYPTFANMVSVAHLKSVERKKPGQREESQHVYKGTAPAWSFDSTGTYRMLNSEDESEDAEDGLAALLGLGEPAAGSGLGRITDNLFAKQWRRLNKDVFLQMAFLTSIEPAEFSEIFKVEVPPNLLADILATVCTCFRAAVNAREDPEQQRLLRAACAPLVDELWTVRMLQAMADCGRFSLAIGFVGEKTRAMVRALLAHLLSSDWCKNYDPATDSERQPSPLSRIQNMTALYGLQQ